MSAASFSSQGELTGLGPWGSPDVGIASILDGLIAKKAVLISPLCLGTELLEPWAISTFSVEFSVDPPVLSSVPFSSAEPGVFQSVDAV